MKRNLKNILILGAGLILIIACKKDIIKNTRYYAFPEYIDTSTKPINEQIKQIYTTSSGVTASNMFNGARLNNFSQINDSTFTLKIEPENIPINPSAWYAFKIWSPKSKNVYLNFEYTYASHRYVPKYSMDGLNWSTTPENDIKTNGKLVQTKIKIGKDTTWVAAQELFTTEHLNKWLLDRQRINTNFSISSYGKSKLGRDMKMATLFPKSNTQKEVIVLMSRQHPPEVTGQFAFLHFVERLQEKDPLTEAFAKKYQVLLFPMQNPDGVDMGHWRHNAGGIDLNRDWDKYNQPETKQMAEYIEAYASKNNQKVVLGLDFHSTFEDVYYTNLSDTATTYPAFTNTWLKAIKDAIPSYVPNIAPSKVGQPVSKGWFFVNFKAVGITYEIGDDTPREFIKTKSRISAEKMMEVLLEGGR